MAVSDITSLKQAEEAQHRMEAMVVVNRELRREIARRRAVEKALRKSEQHHSQLLEQSRHMQEQLRLLSRQLLLAQEEERKKISRELHDVIAQTLTGINVQLATLKIGGHEQHQGSGATHRPHAAVGGALGEHRPSVCPRAAPGGVGRPGADSRPARVRENTSSEETGIRVSLSAFAAVEQVNGDKRTVLYRVAQEALTNVARHAQASQAEVKIQKLDGAICMEIRDDGKGFQAGTRVARAKRGHAWDCSG